MVGGSDGSLVDPERQISFPKTDPNAALRHVRLIADIVNETRVEVPARMNPSDGPQIEPGRALPEGARDEWREPFLHHIAYGAEPRAVPSQVSIAARLLDVFEHEFGLLQDGQALPLCGDAGICPKREGCWKAVPRDRVPTGKEAAASIPWVGPAYADERIVVMPINFNGFGGLGGNWWMTHGHRRYVAGELSEDERRERSGPTNLFAKYVASYLAAVRRSVQGLEVRADYEPSELAEGLDAMALMQSAQCSPGRDAGKPTAAMRRNCPERHLLPQIEALEPEILITVGATARDAVDRFAPGSRSRDWAAIRSSTLADREITLINVRHPGRGQGEKALRALQELLAAQPLLRRAR